MEFIRNPGGPYRNTQSICMPAVRTYVRHVIHGIIHATNPLSENAQGHGRALCAPPCVSVCVDTYVPELMCYLEMAPGIM